MPVLVVVLGLVLYAAVTAGGDRACGGRPVPDEPQFVKGGYGPFDMKLAVRPKNLSQAPFHEFAFSVDASNVGAPARGIEVSLEGSAVERGLLGYGKVRLYLGAVQMERSPGPADRQGNAVRVVFDDLTVPTAPDRAASAATPATWDEWKETLLRVVVDCEAKAPGVGEVSLIVKPLGHGGGGVSHTFPVQVSE